MLTVWAWLGRPTNNGWILLLAAICIAAFMPLIRLLTRLLPI